MTIREFDEGVTLTVRVVPRSRQNEIVGVEGDAIKIRLSAPAIEGRANDALVRFLAERLGVARSRIEIVRGESSRSKVVRVRGVSAEAVRARLGL